MSKVWEAIKQVERERELAGRQRAVAESETNDQPITAYLTSVRRRCRERFTLSAPLTVRGSKPRP